MQIDSIQIQLFLMNRENRIFLRKAGFLHISSRTDKVIPSESLSEELQTSFCEYRINEFLLVLRRR